MVLFRTHAFLALTVLSCAPAERRIAEERRCASLEPPAALAVPWLPVEVARHAAIITAASEAHGIDADLVAIVTLVESGGFERARSPSGATGLMQLMPSTAEDVAGELGLEGHDDERLEVGAYNVDLGAYYLARQLADFGGDVVLAASAYNGGPNALRKHLAAGAPLSAQTQRYRHWVSGMWRERHAPRSEVFAAWVAAGGERLLGLSRLEMRRNR